jgi:hypothetical protein
MTAEEIKIARALREVNMPFASKTKSIVLVIALQARTHPDKDLTPAQRSAMVSIALKYRRQLAEEVVTLAQTMKAEAA